jgi:hypothetical protein
MPRSTLSKVARAAVPVCKAHFYQLCRCYSVIAATATAAAATAAAIIATAAVV